MPSYKNWWIAAIPLAIVVLAIWRSSKTVPDVNGQPEESPPQQDEPYRPSADFAALIHAINAQGDANREEEKTEDRGKKFREYTIIVLLGLTLWVSRCQFEEMQKVYEPVREQAQAATRQVMMMQNSERARFAIRQIILHRSMDKDPSPTIGYTWVNVGRSAAIVTAVYMECAAIQGFGPGYANASAYHYANNAVGTGADFDAGEKLPCHIPQRLSETDWDAIAKKERGFFVKGYIQFNDVFGRIHMQRLADVAYADGVFYPLAGNVGNEEIDETDSQMEQRQKAAAQWNQ